MDWALGNGIKQLQELTVEVFGQHVISTSSRGVSSPCRTT